MESERVRFGSFEFDHANGELRRDGMLIRLQAQPAMVLSHLLAYAGEIVSREELRHAIWGDDTFVDFERGLNVCIAQIRSALSDESTSPRFIRTVPRRGYQFIHPVEPISASAPPEPDSDAARREFPWRTSLASLGSIALVVLLIVGFVQWRRNSQGASGPAVVAVVPFDNETGDASVNRFCSALTDNVIEQLTSVEPEPLPGDRERRHSEGSQRATRPGPDRYFAARAIRDSWRGAGRGRSDSHPCPLDSHAGAIACVGCSPGAALRRSFHARVHRRPGHRFRVLHQVGRPCVKHRLTCPRKSLSSTQLALNIKLAGNSPPNGLRCGIGRIHPRQQFESRRLKH